MLRDHLAVCADCSCLEQELLQLHRDLSLQSVEPPAHLEASIMAKIRAEAPPSAPTTVPVRDKTTFRRWFSTAAAFFLVITATVLGSRVLPLEQGGDTAPGNMDKAAYGESVPREKSSGEDEGTQIASFKAAADTEAPAAARSSDLPAETPNDSAQRSTYSAPHTAVSGDDSNPNTGNSANASTDKEAADTEADGSASSAPGYGGAANALAPESSMPQSVPPENTYTAGGLPESETAPAGDKRPSADQLDAEAAEILLLDYLALPTSTPVTVTYEGLTPKKDAHLFVVTRPNTIAETYSVDRTKGTITLLPSSDPASTPAP